MTTRCPGTIELPARRTWAGALRLCTCVGGVALLTGCSGEDDNSTAIAKARNTMTALSAGGSGAPPAALLEKSAGEVATSLGDRGEGDEPSAAFAQSLAGQALGAQGLVAADQYRRLDSELLRAVTAAQSTLNLYRQQRSLEDANKGYDPSVDIRAFDAQIQEQQQERAAAQKDLQAVESRVAELRDRAKALRASTQQATEAEASLRSQALSADAQQRLRLITEATWIRRKTDLTLKEADLTDAQADRVAPETDEVRLRIERADSRIGALGQAKQRALDLAQTRQADATHSAQGARETANLLGANLKEVRTMLDEQVGPAFDAAISKYNNAVSRVSSAREGGSRQAAQGAVGGLVQATAGLHRERAESLARVAALLEQAGVESQLPERESVTQAAAAIREQAEAASQAAMDAYDRARSAFESAGGGTGGVNDQFQFLARGSAVMYERLGGKPAEPPAQPTNEPEPASEEPQATEQPPEGSIQPEKPSEGPAEQPTEQPKEAPPSETTGA